MIIRDSWSKSFVFMLYFSFGSFHLYFWDQNKKNQKKKCGLLQRDGCFLKQHIMERCWLCVNFAFNWLDIKMQADN